MNRPAFQNSELGPIPVDWEVKRLGEIAEICTGKRNGDEQVENGLYPFFVRSSVVYRINSFSYDGEAILIPGEGGIGEIFHYINGRFDFHQRVYKISDFAPNVCARYIYYFMRMYFGNWAKEQTVKATVDSLRMPTFEMFKVPLPPLSEQRRIAAALSDADAWIESLDNLIEKKKLVKQGAMQALLSGKTRLPGFSGKWVEKRLGDCMIVNPPNDRMIPETFFYIDLESVTKGRLAGVAEIQKVNAPSRAQRLFQKGDILFQTVRPYQNNNLFVDFEAKQFVASTGYAIFRAKCDTDARWMFEIIQTPQFTDHVMDNCTGTGYPAINPGKLAEIPFLMPPSLAEQRGIAAILSDMDAEHTALSREKAKAEQIKQGMMQELLTGRVRLAGGE